MSLVLVYQAFVGRMEGKGAVVTPVEHTPVYEFHFVAGHPYVAQCATAQEHVVFICRHACGYRYFGYSTLAEGGVLEAGYVVGQQHGFKVAFPLECRAWYGIGGIGPVCSDIYGRDVESREVHVVAHEVEVAGIDCSEQSEVFDGGVFAFGDEAGELSGFLYPYAAFFLHLRGFLHQYGYVLVFFYIADGVVIGVGRRLQQDSVGFDGHHILRRVGRCRTERIVPSAYNFIVAGKGDSCH